MSFSSDDFCGDFGLDNFDSFSDSDAGYFDEPIEFDHAPKAAKPAAKKAKKPAAAKTIPAPVLPTPVPEAAPEPVLAAPEVHTGCDVMSFDADFSFSFIAAVAPEICDDDGLEIWMNPQVPCAAALRARRKMIDAVNHGQMALFA